MSSDKLHEDIWMRVDTTNYKIRFDIAEFERIKKEHSDWLKEWCLKQKKPFKVIRYKEFHSKENTLLEQLSIIKYELSRVIPEYLLKSNSEFKPINKQDNGKLTDFYSKLTNYDEVADYLHCIQRL